MAVTSYMTAERFWNAQQPKELHWIDGATHVSLYDKESHVTLAIAKLSHFFRSRLGESTSGDRAWRQAWTDDAVHTGSP
jgi:hypothetical protein